MSYTMVAPELPTHAVKHTDNWAGTLSVLVSLVFVVGGDYYHIDGGSPVLEHKGDAIHSIWPLNQANSINN